MKLSEKWLREWVDPSLTTQQLTEQLTMAGLEIGSVVSDASDTLMEVELTPNRGDCLSMLGMAREIAALNQIDYAKKEVPAVKPLNDQKLEISIQAPDCARYVGRVIRQVRLAQTPVWIQERLTKCDINTIHPVVDILNYVMLELGQPMHAFDLDKLQAPIIVRHAQVEEPITLLDGQEIKLKANTLVIADGQGAQAIAGVMGGKESSVSESTQNIFLESALFLPHLMAGKARQYGLQTDSSYRFERGVDPQLQVMAMERATALIVEICGGEPGALVDKVKGLPQFPSILLRYERIEGMLGVELEPAMVIGILQRLGCEVIEQKNSSEKSWLVTPPSFRYDMTLEVDLIEEIARLYGYNQLPTHLPAIPAQFLMASKDHPSVGRIKRHLVDLGYHEVITYSFVADNWQKMLFPQEPIALLNPLSAEMGVMRVSLWPGLLETMKFNQYRQQQRCQIFEVGCRFNHENGQVTQKQVLAGLLAGDAVNEQWGLQKRPADFYDVKYHIESLWQLTGQREPLTWRPAEHPACHPGQCAEIVWKGEVKGVVGKLHPKAQKQLDISGAIYLFELKLDTFSLGSPHYARPSRFPEIRRDLAMLIDRALPSEKILNFVRSSAGEICREVKIFDVYTGKGIDSGRKSIAIGLILQHSSRTLVDNEVDELMQSIIQGLKKEFQAELRE